MENTNQLIGNPSVGGSYSFAWRKIFGKSFLPLLIAVIIVGLLTGPSYSIKFDADDFGFPMFFFVPFAILGLAYVFLFVPVLKYGRNYLFLQAMRDEEADLKTLFEGFKTKYLNIILANLIVYALVLLGLMIIIIPGIIVGCRLAFVSYLVMDKNMEPMKAVEKSWNMTRGHGWKIFGLAIVSIFVFMVGVVVFFVGVLFSLMWIQAAYASLYLAVETQNSDDNPIPILGVNEE